MTNALSLLLGWLLDLLLGDPQRLPHPVVWFGRLIAFGEHRLNRGSHRKAKGAVMAITLILLVFALTWFVRSQLCIVHYALCIVFDTVAIFYCLAGTTLIREVRAVFLALDCPPARGGLSRGLRGGSPPARGGLSRGLRGGSPLDEGRQQVARIVGRDTSQLTAQEVRTAALETLAENLSDGVIAPLFWLALLGTPGMLAYKMVNTLDSMIGYRTERYRDFGCWAAHIDDVANYLPARLTALLMLLPSLLPHPQLPPCLRGAVQRTEGWEPPCLRGAVQRTEGWELLTFVLKNGRNHASPNSGYPEAALAAILDCRFGGPHRYFGEIFDKPYIGTNDRPLTTADMKKAVRINRTAEVLMVVVVTAFLMLRNTW